MKRMTCIVVLGAVLAACGSGGNAASATTSRPVRSNVSAGTASTAGGSKSIVVPAARTLAVICVGTAIHVSTKVVQAQADGVHLSITFTSRSGGSVSYTQAAPISPDGVESTAGAGMGFLSRGPWSEVWPALAPGDVIFKCTDSGVRVPEQSIDVVDPHHYWTPISVLSCAPTSVHAGAPGGSAVEATRSWLTNGHAHDEIRVQGYMSAQPATIGIIQNTKLVADLTVSPGGGSGHTWLIDGDSCATF